MNCRESLLIITLWGQSKLVKHLFEQSIGAEYATSLYPRNRWLSSLTHMCITQLRDICKRMWLSLSYLSFCIFRFKKASFVVNMHKKYIPIIWLGLLFLILILILTHSYSYSYYHSCYHFHFLIFIVILILFLIILLIIIIIININIIVINIVIIINIIIIIVCPTLDISQP